MNDVGIEIIKLRKSGLSLKKIRAITKCSTSTISKYCSMMPEHQEIIINNFNNRKYEVKKYGCVIIDRKRRELDLLRQRKPDNPSWFNNYKARLRESTKAFLIQVGGGGCQICKYNKCMECLVFHHLDPNNKEFAISGMRLTYASELLIKEVEKCALLCSNCHGEIHAGMIYELKPIKCTIEIPDSLIEWYFKK